MSSDIPPLPSFTPHNIQRPSQSSGTIDRLDSDTPHLLQQRSAPATLHSTGSSSRSPSGQKRAYRQRRKDPSCDACRDRKVKCDATDDKSCSECSGRGVRCQFTKETNRRMSSMKQLQDLHNQLAAARRHISELQAVIGGSHAVGSSILRTAETNQPTGIDAQALLGNANSVHNVQRNIRTYAKELVRTPGESLQSSSSDMIDLHLPSAHTTRALITRYFECINTWCPLVDQQEIETTVNEFYQSNGRLTVSKGQAGVLYAILACGAITTTHDENRLGQEEQVKCLRLATDNIYTNREEVSLDNITLAALLSVYHLEMTMYNESAIWLATAVRMAQIASLHITSFDSSSNIAQSRERVWACLCLLDRIVALELSLPMLISLDDCCNSDLQVMADMDDDSGEDKAHEETSQSMLGSIDLLTNTTAILKSTATTSSSTITDAITARLDLLAGTYDRPHYTHALILLQSCQLLIARHNLSPTREKQQRHEALKQCVSIAEATTKHLWLSTPSEDSHEPEAIQQRHSAINAYLPSFVCRHLWRCTLLLCLAGEYSKARSIITLFGSARSASLVTRPCRRYIRFFLEQLINKASREQNSWRDEELVAYASADMQQNPHVAWIWQTLDESASSQKTADIVARKTGQKHFTPDDSAIKDWRQVQDLIQQLEERSQQPVPMSVDKNNSTLASHSLTNTALPSLYSVMASPNLQQQSSTLGQIMTPSVSPVNRISIKDLM